MFYRSSSSVVLLSTVIIWLAGCGSKPIKIGTENQICSVLKQNRHWYREIARAEKRWGTPKAVIMAIMHQESRYKASALPPRNYVLGFIPWGRKSTAYGFAQVKDGTWDHYKKATGNRRARRDDFGSAADFVGWYTHLARKKAGIAPSDARSLYLAYHEGVNGFIRGRHRRKPWLMKVADKVAGQAWRFRQQLKQCEHKYSKRQYIWG